MIGRLIVLGVVPPGRNVWNSRNSPVAFGRIVKSPDGGSDLRLALYRQGFPFREVDDPAAETLFDQWLNDLELSARSASTVTTPEQTVREELLDRGLNDMLMLGEMASVAARHLGQPREETPTAVGVTVKVIVDLLESGDAIVGLVVRGEDGLLGVESWGLSPTDAANRIESEWNAIGSLGLGDVCWLELTDTGRLEANRLRAR